MTINNVYISKTLCRRNSPTLTCPDSGRFSMRWKRLRSVPISRSLRSTNWGLRAAKLERYIFHYFCTSSYNTFNHGKRNPPKWTQCSCFSTDTDLFIRCIWCIKYYRIPGCTFGCFVFAVSCSNGPFFFSGGRPRWVKYLSQHKSFKSFRVHTIWTSCKSWLNNSDASWFSCSVSASIVTPTKCEKLTSEDTIMCFGKPAPPIRSRTSRFLASGAGVIVMIRHLTTLWRSPDTPPSITGRCILISYCVVIVQNSITFMIFMRIHKWPTILCASWHKHTEIKHMRAHITWDLRNLLHAFVQSKELRHTNSFPLMAILLPSVETCGHQVVRDTKSRRWFCFLVPHRNLQWICNHFMEEK